MTSNIEFMVEIGNASREIYGPAVMKAIHDKFDAVYRMKQHTEPFLMNIEDIKVPPEWQETSQVSEVGVILTDELLSEAAKGKADFTCYISEKATELADLTISHIAKDCGDGRSIVVRASSGLITRHDPSTDSRIVLARLRYIVIASDDAPALVDNGVLEKVERDDVA